MCMNAGQLLNEAAKICKESPKHGQTPILLRTDKGDFELKELIIQDHSPTLGLLCRSQTRRDACAMTPPLPSRDEPTRELQPLSEQARLSLLKDLQSVCADLVEVPISPAVATALNNLRTDKNFMLLVEIVRPK